MPDLRLLTAMPGTCMARAKARLRAAFGAARCHAAGQHDACRVQPVKGCKDALTFLYTSGSLAWSAPAIATALQESRARTAKERRSGHGPDGTGRTEGMLSETGQAEGRAGKRKAAEKAPASSAAPAAPGPRVVTYPGSP